MQITCVFTWYYMDFTWICFHISIFIKCNRSFCFLAGTQSACWMFTRIFALDPLHGWLLPFILYWDKNPCGMNEGEFPPRWTRRTDNPTGARLRPTPEEIQARMAEEKEKRVQEEDRRQAQIERDLGGAPSTAAPDRSWPAAMKLQPIPDRFVPDHLSHLRGVRGFQPLSYWD